MSLNEGVLSSTFGLRYALFSLDMLLYKYNDYQGATQFDSMPSNGYVETICDVQSRLDCNTEPDASVQRWTCWGGRGKVPRSDDILYVNIPSVVVKNHTAVRCG